MTILKNIPNLITSANLLLGSVACVFALSGDINLSIYLILISSILDFLDGFLARLLKSASEFGKQLDSLADLISFGLAPSFLIYKVVEINSIFPGLLIFLPFLIVIFTALRLAKFNIDQNQVHEFKGLPSPASALFIISMVWYINNVSGGITDQILKPYYLGTIIIALSFLMVSNIKMFSLKIKLKNIKNHFYPVILIILSLILILLFGVIGISMSIILYIFMSVIKLVINNKT